MNRYWKKATAVCETHVKVIKKAVTKLKVDRNTYMNKQPEGQDLAERIVQDAEEFQTCTKAIKQKVQAIKHFIDKQ